MQTIGRSHASVSGRLQCSIVLHSYHRNPHAIHNAVGPIHHCVLRFVSCRCLNRIATTIARRPPTVSTAGVRGTSFRIRMIKQIKSGIHAGRFHFDKTVWHAIQNATIHGNTLGKLSNAKATTKIRPTRTNKLVPGVDASSCSLLGSTSGEVASTLSVDVSHTADNLKFWECIRDTITCARPWER